MAEKKYLDSTGLIRLVANVLNKFADKSHNHDDRYYTESEIDTKVNSLQSSIDSVDGAISNITDGDIVVAEAEHATTADSATTAAKADKATSADSATEATHAASADSATTATTAATCTGNAATATKLAAAQTITLGGDASGSVSFDGSAAKTLTVTITDDSHNHVISNIDGLQSALDGKAASSHTHDDRYYTEDEIDAKIDAIVGEGASTTLDTIGEISAAIEENQDMLTTLNNAIGGKQATITGGATTITSSNLTASRALVSDGNGKVAVSAVTSTELGYLDGVTSAIQTQLNNKAASNHTHTPASIGAAASSHTHTIADVTNLQTELDSLSDNKADKSAIPTIDSAMSSTSTNPVQNKVVYNQLSLILSDIDEASEQIGALETQVSDINSALDTHGHNATEITFDDDKALVASGSNVQAVIESLDYALNDKADSSHTHTIANVTNLQTTLDELKDSIPTVDSALSTTSTNPVQNKVVTSWLGENVKEYALMSSSNNDGYDYLYLASSGVSTIAAEPDDGSGNTYGTSVIGFKDFNGLVHKIKYVSEVPSKVLVTNSACEVTESSISTTELNYLSGIESNIQTQLDNKIGKSDVDSALSSTSTNPIQNKILYDVITSMQDEIDDKAASSHSHSASDITSGTLGVARGGTGLTSNPSMLVNLGSTSAASVLAASPRPGITGTLPIANGGTGGTTAATARTNLEVYSKAEIDSTVSTLNTAISGKAASSHTHTIADVTNLSEELDALMGLIGGKADKSHTHVISDVTNLQSSLDSKFDKAGGTVTGATTFNSTVTIGSATLSYDTTEEALVISFA